MHAFHYMFWVCEPWFISSVDFWKRWERKTHGNRVHSETLTLVSPSCFQKKFRIVTDGNLPTLLEMGLRGIVTVYPMQQR